MKRSTLSWILMSGILATMAQGATLRYRTSGPWESLATWDPAANDGAGAWTGAGWMKESAPDVTDTVRANWGGQFGNTVTLGYDTTVGQFQIGVDEGGTFHILSGGILRTSTGNNKVGNNTPNNPASDKYNNPITGALIIDAGGEVHSTGWLMIAGNSGALTGEVTVSGVLNSASHLWMATGGQKADTGPASNAILTINGGGVVNVGENIGLGTINAKDPSGGTATITVNNGGTLNLHHWSNAVTEPPEEAHDGSIQDGSVLVINGGGTVNVGGNRVAQANEWFAEGKIASDTGMIEVSFDAGANLTTITAPAPALTVAISTDESGSQLTWNSQAGMAYNVWGTADLSEDLANWDLAKGNIPASPTGTTTASIPFDGSVRFYRVEEFEKPPAILNASFEEPALPTDGDFIDAIGAPWVLDGPDGAGTVYTWNPFVPDDYTMPPNGSNVASIVAGTADGTAFGIKQVLAETYAAGTNYTVTAKVGRSLFYDWSGYRIELWAGGTMLASDDDLTTTAPAAGSFITATVAYDSASGPAATPGEALEIRLHSRGMDVDNPVPTGNGFAADFDDVTFSATAP